MKYGFCLVVFGLMFASHAHVSEPATVRTMFVKSVSTGIQRYSGRVADCARDLTHVRVKVSRAGVTVYGGGVKFSDGSAKTATFKQTFEAGYTSPWISLEYLGSDGRCIQKVYVDAEGTNPKMNSRVEVQGRYTN